MEKEIKLKNIVYKVKVVSNEHGSALAYVNGRRIYQYFPFNGTLRQTQEAIKRVVKEYQRLIDLDKAIEEWDGII